MEDDLNIFLAYLSTIINKVLLMQFKCPLALVYTLFVIL
jgi:hypothetical protein